jgi:hypothetical protein
LQQNCATKNLSLSSNHVSKHVSFHDHENDRRCRYISFMLN